MNPMNPHLHWTVVCGTPLYGFFFKSYKIRDRVSVEVLAETEEEAIELSKTLIDRDIYQVSHVRQCFMPDDPSVLDEIKRIVSIDE